MPALVRKLLIFATVDGLILQPLPQLGQRPQTAVKIGFDDGSIRPALDHTNHDQSNKQSFEAFGIAGLVTVSKFSFLISITRRQQVAQIQGKAIYVVTEVALTPLTSKGEAEASISRTRAGLQKGLVDEQNDVPNEYSAEEEDLSTAVSDEVDDSDLAPAPTVSTGAQQVGYNGSPSIAKDVISRKGSYGRFAQKWFSKSGWTAGQRRSLGMSISESGALEKKAPKEAAVSKDDSQDLRLTKGPDIKDYVPNEVTSNLLPKLLRTTQVLLGSSHSFYFSYDHDITRNFTKQEKTSTDPPLHSVVDPFFFWNRNIMRPFIEAGQSTLVLPLMQGFVGQQNFTMDTNPPIVGLEEGGRSSMEMSDLSKNESSQATTLSSEHGQIAHAKHKRATERDFLLTLISRRSVKRAGLRYLRRGVDEDGHVANEVETEQILSYTDPVSQSLKLQTFLQLRGSIPIFWAQSPYSFKPVPTLQRSFETNYQAIQMHLDDVSTRYGSVQIATLVEKHGNEAVVGEEYAKYVSQVNEAHPDKGAIGFEWFDFHAVCRGMHFENVSYLLDALQPKVYEYGSSVLLDGNLISKQKGVIRTNCMDCLDRSNVVQSACARDVLETQLKSEGIETSLQVDQSTCWFDSLWADNGDAISKQYASTAAMKGDFTRTRKRNYKGALTDIGLSLSRFYSGIVNDYFSQAAISFLVGDATEMIFADFEATLMSEDPAISMRKMRQQAIDACQKLVVADEREELVGGWTVLTPHVSNTIKSTPFEEVVLLVTSAALYACRFDWSTEKLASFERVDSEHIRGIKYGTYITSILSAAQSDEKRNVGFVITYEVGRNDIMRVNTRSMSTVQDLKETPLQPLASKLSPPGKKPKPAARESSRPSGERILAFKALPAKSAASEDRDTPVLSELEQVQTMCAEIERMVLLVTAAVDTPGTEKRSIVHQGSIITLAEARKSTGLIEQLGHSLKKLVWA